MENTKEAKATLCHSGGSQLVTLAQLAELPTPEPTKTWKPIPHADVPTIITDLVTEHGWHYAGSIDDNPFKISVTPNGNKMFGVCQLVVPGVLEGETDFGLAIGFCNSHDKSMSLQVVVGTNVFICDNMIINGDFKVRREHTSGIDPIESLRKAFGYIPEIAGSFTDWFGGMRNRHIDADEGIGFLAKCVEHKALPIGDFMDARSNFLNGFLSDLDIQHGGTMWSAYQAVTAQWKKHSLMQLPVYSHNLNELVREQINWEDQENE